MTTNNRATFGSKLGAILATVGCAVGLGNIWRFPYMVGENGGAAFLIVYIICILLLGLPVMITEFFIGRHSRRNVAGAFKQLAPGTKWSFIGYNGVLAAFLILGFYSVVAGWTLEYILQACTGSLAGKTAADFTQEFELFSTDALRHDARHHYERREERHRARLEADDARALPDPLRALRALADAA